jgi:hypothetical protein
MKANWKMMAAGLALVFGLSGGAWAQTYTPREGRTVARDGSPAYSVQTVADHDDHRGFRNDDRRWGNDRDHRWADNGRWNWDRDHDRRLDRDHDRNWDRDHRYVYGDQRGPWYVDRNHR